MTNFRQRIHRCLTRGIALAVSVLTLSAVSAQNPAVTGRVTDGEGAPLLGVIVSQQGTNTASVTGVDGTYSISVPGTASLDFNLMGFAGQTVAVNGRRTVDVTLLPSATAIDDVVVVGYGTVRRTDMTGSVAVLSDTKLKTVTTPRVEDMLSGKAPGVFVASGSSQPGSEGAIVIRGKTTVSGSTAPLWVIDGVIVGSHAGDLNPSDVESMTVLKDAASTAIYGSQGSNGVIVVSTKKGRAGHTEVSFSAKAGTSHITTGNQRMMNGQELYDLYNSYPDKSAFSSNPWWNADLAKRDFDWKKQISQTGVTQDYSVSVRGGSETVRVYSSLGYYKEKGAIKGYDYERFSGRVNVDWKAFDWLTIKPSASLSRRDYLNKEHSATNMYTRLPWDSPYNADGSLFELGTDADVPWIGTFGNARNYLYDLQWNYGEGVEYQFSGNFDFSIKLTDYLSFDSVNAYRFGSETWTNYVDPRASNGRAQNGSIAKNFEGYNTIYNNHLFRFNKTFNDVHTVTALAAYEWNEWNYEDFNFRKTGIAPGAQIPDLAALPETAAGKREDWAMQSIFANANYEYDGRYVLQASIRRDGSSKFGTENRYGTFFSFSGAWNMHNEEFFAPLTDIFNSARVRLSYGSTGNTPTGLYGSYTLYSLTGVGNTYNGKNGAVMGSTAGNPKMTWETTYTLNFGFDASLWSNRLNVSFDIYNKDTSGLLYKTQLPPAWGVIEVWRNVGKVTNKGVELTVDGDIFRSNDFSWNVGLNIGANRNKVVELAGNADQQIAGADGGISLAGIAQKLLKPGYDMDTWYVPEWAGVNPDDGTPQWYYNDEEHGRTITSNVAQARQVMMGSYTPKFYGGINTSVNWKWIDFAAMFAYSYGGKIYNYSRQEYDADGAYVDRNQMNLQPDWNRWEKPGDIATHPQARYGGNASSNAISSRYLEDASYLKLKNVTLGFNIPLQSEFISGLRVYVSGENLVTFTKYSGVDPEIPIDRKEGGVLGTVVPGVRPPVKRVMFGANITF